MNKQELEKWFHDRTEREKIGIYLGGFFIIYFLWAMLISHPLNKAIDNQKKSQEDLQKQIATLQNQLTSILQILTDPHFQQIFSEERKLKTQTQNLGARLQTIAPNVLSPDDYPKVVKSILSIPTSVALIEIKHLPVEPWIPKELSDLSLPVYFTSIFKYNLQVEFHGNYFSTLDYLQKLEKLPWHIYWDQMDYKVMLYPNADVVVKLHVLIEQKATVPVEQKK